MVNSFVTHGSYVRNSGRYFETLSSQPPIFLSAMSIAMLAAVNALEFDAMAKSVSASTLSGLFMSRTP